MLIMTNVPGGWEIAEMQPAPLPEKVASAFTEVTSSLLGAKYVPVLYCGQQIVHGSNHMIICEQTISAKDAPKHLVTMTINISEQGSSMVEINKII